MRSRSWAIWIEVTASLTFDEVAIVLLQELVARPPFNVSQDRTRYLSRHPENVSQLMGTVSPLLSAASSVVDIAPVTGDDISAMTRAMGAYGMLPRDAIHLAVAQRLGITAIVSDDDVFDRVPGLMLFRP
ncbi:MAG: PINc protein [Chloroflexi bacterium]|nr:PINc protein [Chloroflexota bacterium]